VVSVVVWKVLLAERFLVLVRALDVALILNVLLLLDFMAVSMILFNAPTLHQDGIFAHSKDTAGK
jgi:hypothetical protein